MIIYMITANPRLSRRSLLRLRLLVICIVAECCFLPLEVSAASPASAPNVGSSFSNASASQPIATSNPVILAARRT